MEKSRLPEIIDEFPIIGAVCTQSKISEHSTLVLGFGELIPFEYSKLKDHKHGLLEIRSYTCCWRIFINGKMNVGRYDDEDVIKPIIDSIVGLKLLKIDISEYLADATLFFSNGIALHFYDNSSKEVSWEFFGPKSWIGIGPATKLEISPNDSTSERSEIEKRIEIHAENTHDRWKSVVPNKCDAGQCNNCAFYCPLQGNFFFWDYGLCSNQKSIFDGKVVNVKSGCNFFSVELEKQ